jgi:hypothetical protein
MNGLTAAIKEILGGDNTQTWFTSVILATWVAEIGRIVV